MRTVRKCDFDFLTEWFYPVFFTGQFLTFIDWWTSQISTFIDRWTYQYPILAYNTWHDFNQSQPHISIRGITNVFISNLADCLHLFVSTVHNFILQL